MSEEVKEPVALGKPPNMSLIVWELEECKYTGYVVVSYGGSDHNFSWMAEKQGDIYSYRITDDKTKKPVGPEYLELFTESLAASINQYRADKSFPKRRRFNLELPFVDLAKVEKWYRFWESVEGKQHEILGPESLAKLSLLLKEMDGKWRFRGEIMVIENKKKEVKDFQWWVETNQGPECGKYETKIYRQSLLVKEVGSETKLGAEDVEAFFEEPIRKSIESYCIKPNESTYLYDIVASDFQKTERWNNFWSSLGKKETQSDATA